MEAIGCQEIKWVGRALHVELKVAKEFQDLEVEQVDSICDLHAVCVKRLTSFDWEVVHFLAKLFLRVSRSCCENQPPFTIESLEYLSGSCPVFALTTALSH